LWCKLQARAKTPETGGGAGGKRERREKTFLKLRKLLCIVNAGNPSKHLSFVIVALYPGSGPSVENGRLFHTLRKIAKSLFTRY
jgi:hypothetical protein